MEVEVSSDCLVTFHNLKYEDANYFFNQFEDTPFFNANQITTRSYCHNLAMSVYAEPTYYESTTELNKMKHLPGITNNEYRVIYAKIFDAYFKAMFGRRLKNIVIGHEHDSKGKCFIQTCIMFSELFQGIIKPGKMIIVSDGYPLINNVCLYYMNQKAKFTQAMNKYCKNATDFYLYDNTINDTTIIKEDNKGNNSLISYFKLNTIKPNCKKKNEEQKSESMIELFKWIPNQDVFKHYSLIEKWFYSYAIPESLPNRKALLLYSDFPFLGKTEFAKRLVNNSSYYLLIANKLKDISVESNPKLGILDSLSEVSEDHQAMKDILTGHSSVVKENNNKSYYIKYAIPWIITTRNWEIVKFFYKSDEFNKYIIFVEIRDYLGPKGTEPPGINEIEASFTQKTLDYLKQEDII